jgi:hypothetical protein
VVQEGDGPTSPPLTGGVGHTQAPMRALPEVPLSPCPSDYARFLCEGMDSLQESFWLKPSLELVEMLDATQRAARELQDNLEGTVELKLGDECFKAHATGMQGGFRWRLSNDDLLLAISAPSRDWGISCRYLSAGLWEHGAHALRERAFSALRGYTEQCSADAVRVTRADWCFDFYSPALTQELRPGCVANVVAHSSVKKFEFGTVTVGERSQTATIGKMPGLQLQLYDKSREIDEASGKTWFYPIWVAGLDGEWPWVDKPRDVWRLETRMGREFLKDRNVRRPHEFEQLLPELITDALFMRRLVVPREDQNRARWPMHPIWSEAYRIRGTEQILPVGRKVTGVRDVLVERGIKQVAGALRSLAELDGGYDERKVVSLADRARKRIEDDPRHGKKLEAARMRYSDVEEAK